MVNLAVLDSRKGTQRAQKSRAQIPSESWRDHIKDKIRQQLQVLCDLETVSMLKPATTVSFPVIEPGMMSA
jgi:hypothetical protein